MTGPVEQLAADWLRSTKRVEVDEVHSVSAYGSDWAGSTEDGFHAQCSVTIVYVSEGRTHYHEVDGEDFPSLWQHVVSALPVDAQV